MATHSIVFSSYWMLCLFSHICFIMSIFLKHNETKEFLQYGLIKSFSSLETWLQWAYMSSDEKIQVVTPFNVSITHVIWAGNSPSFVIQCYIHGVKEGLRNNKSKVKWKKYRLQLGNRLPLTLEHSTRILRRNSLYLHKMSRTKPWWQAKRELFLCWIQMTETHRRAGQRDMHSIVAQGCCSR
jgi:hypothetical protein